VLRPPGVDAHLVATAGAGELRTHLGEAHG
jgi:hypothetical protein